MVKILLTVFLNLTAALDLNNRNDYKSTTMSLPSRDQREDRDDFETSNKKRKAKNREDQMSSDEDGTTETSDKKRKANKGAGRLPNDEENETTTTSDNLAFTPWDLLDIIPVIGTLRTGKRAIEAFHRGNISELKKTAWFGFTAASDVLAIGTFTVGISKAAALYGAKEFALTSVGYVAGTASRNLGKNKILAAV